MGNPLAGVGGAVKAGAATLANVGNWSVSIKGGIAKTTSFGATGAWETNASTIKSWSAKFDGRTDPADTTGQVTLFNGIGSTLSMEFDIDGTHHWAGSAILTGIEPKADATGMNEVSFAVDGTGALSYT
jgi:hypothetical protein